LRVGFAVVLVSGEVTVSATCVTCSAISLIFVQGLLRTMGKCGHSFAPLQRLCASITILYHPWQLSASPQKNARYRDTRREGQCCRYATHRNSVHQSTLSWWVAWKFLDSMRTESPPHPVLPRTSAIWIAQFIAVCRRSRMVAMGTRRPRRGSRLYRRCALPRRGETPRLRQM
jgi:hypothetical protein